MVQYWEGRWSIQSAFRIFYMEKQLQIAAVKGRDMLENNLEDWQDIVYRFGYYDQSHFIHDFKSVTGYTPRKFIDFRQHGAIYLDRFQVVRKVSDLIS